MGSQAFHIIERVTADDKKDQNDDNEDQNEEAAATSKSPSVEKGAPAQDDNDNVPERVESTEMTATSSCTVSLVSEVVVPPTPGRGIRRQPYWKPLTRRLVLELKCQRH